MCHYQLFLRLQRKCRCVHTSSLNSLATSMLLCRPYIFSFCVPASSHVRSCRASMLFDQFVHALSDFVAHREHPACGASEILVGCNVTGVVRESLFHPLRNTFGSSDDLYRLLVKVPDSTHDELSQKRITCVHDYCFIWCISSVRSCRPHVQDALASKAFRVEAIMLGSCIANIFVTWSW